MEVTLNNIVPSAPRSISSLALTLIYPMRLFAVAITRSCSSSVRTLSVSTQSHTRCFTACLSLGVRRRESEAHQSPSSTTGLKRPRWCTSAPPYIFLAWCFENETRFILQTSTSRTFIIIIIIIITIIIIIIIIIIITYCNLAFTRH